MSAADIFNDQQAFVAAQLTSASSFIDRLRELSLLAELDIADVPEPGYLTMADEAISSRVTVRIVPSSPTINDPVAETPVFDEPEVITAEQVTVPDFGRAAPQLDLPAAPPATLPTAPAQPTVDSPVVPTAPTLTLPVAPTIVGLDLPELPSISLPAYTGSLPIDDLVTPTDSFDWAEEIYASELLDATKAKLLDAIENGGYGIEPADEAALWQRARDREVEAAIMEQEQMYSVSASRGFPYPPGDLNIAVARSVQNLANKMSSLSRDIAIKRGDLYVENRKFTITEIRALEQVLISYHMSRMERALNAQRISLDFAISLFAVLVSRYNARLAAYQAEAQVFEAQVRAQLAQVELYRTQMQGKQIESEIQRAAVEVYRAQLEGVQAEVGIYKTQVEAAAVSMGIERAKIDAYRALVDAYAAQVQAKVAEFNMYEARVRGETAKVTAFQAEVQAYAAEVGAAEAKARIAATNVDASAKAAQIKIDSYRANVDRYKTDLDTQIAVINARIQRYGAELQAYSADLQAGAEDARLRQGAWRNEQEIHVKNADIALENARQALEKLRVQYTVQLGSSQTAGTYYAQLIGAANAALTAVATVAD